MLTGRRGDFVARPETHGGPLRIAMVAACPFPYPRGTPIRICRMAEALSRRGHDVEVISYHLGDTGEPLPFRVHRIPELSFYRRVEPGPTWVKLLALDPLLSRTLRRVLADRTFDLVHAHHYEGLLAALAVPARHRPPVIYDAHTLLGTELPFYRLGPGTRVLRRFGRFLDRRLPGKARHVVSVTDEIRDRLIQTGAVEPHRITVVQNGVESLLFDVPPAPTETKTVVFAGNLASYQGVEHLLRAVRILLDRRDDLRLRIVTGTDLGPHAELVRSLGIGSHVDVVLVGFADLPAHLRAADVAVNPRVECDGIPQKLLNYMAAGCPIVSFAGSAGYLEHGVTGWVVSNGDVEALADGIGHLLDHPRLARGLGEAARHLVVNRYSWDRTAEKVEQVYTAILGDPGGRGEGEAARAVRRRKDRPLPHLTVSRTPRLDGGWADGSSGGSPAR
ncbi:MAG: glycosyltransferase family 1 protein [Gemmatimonadales bacterium]|nr:MAG: glycosyltransferase family 1 protein [Gemmatimonadales bacterium]